MLFPLKFLPKESYKEAPRHFGARRSKGKRKHAGCDLYAPVGTPIFAVADGVVLDFYEFYLESWALEVDHGDFVVRYGEVKKTLPAGVALEVVQDGGESAEVSLRNVIDALVFGAGLTVLVVYVFLNSWRSTLITASPATSSQGRSGETKRWPRWRA